MELFAKGKETGNFSKLKFIPELAASPLNCVRGSALVQCWSFDSSPQEEMMSDILYLIL